MPRLTMVSQREMMNGVELVYLSDQELTVFLPSSGAESNPQDRVKRFPRLRNSCLGRYALRVSLRFFFYQLVFPMSGDSPCAAGLFLNVSSSSSSQHQGFCLNFAITPRQDRPVDTVFGRDIAFALLVGEHLTFSEQRVLLPLCLFSRPSLGPAVSWEPTRSPAWHRNERAARRRARRASRRGVATERQKYRLTLQHCSGGGMDMQAVQHIEIGLPTSHVCSAARRSTTGQPALAKRKTRTPSPTRRKSCQSAPVSQTAVPGRRGLGRLRLASGPGVLFVS